MSTKKHTAYNLLGAIVPIGLMLVTVPLYLALVGEERYGVLTIVWLLAGYFGFLDFGLGRATAYAIARLKDASDEERAKTFWTALLVNLGFGLLGAAIMLALAPWLFGHLFNLSSALLAELRPVLPWLALAIPLLTFEGVFGGALTGREKFLSLNLRTIIGSVLTQGIPLVAVWLLSPTLTVAIPATMIARTLSVALLGAIAFRAVPASWRPRYGGTVMMRELLSYGGWVSLASFVNPIIANLDRFLIATFHSVTAVSLYTVPFQLVTRGTVISNAFGNALFPKLAQLDIDLARELAWRALRLNAALMTVLCVAGILFMEPFLALWINPEFAQRASLVGQLISVSLWFHAPSLVSLNFLQAQGRSKETAAVYLLQLVPYVAVAIPGILFMGIAGAVVANNVRSLVDSTLMLSRSGLLRRASKMAIVPLGLLSLSFLAARLLGYARIEGLLCMAALLCVAFAWAFSSVPEIRKWLAHNSRRFLLFRRRRARGKD